MVLSQKTECTPFISVDLDKGKFNIEGRSIPENPAETFIPLIAITKEYNKNPQQKTTVSITLDYANSLTIRHLSLFIRSFQIPFSDYEFHIIWNSAGEGQFSSSLRQLEYTFDQLTSHLKCKKNLTVNNKTGFSIGKTTQNFELKNL